MEDKEVEWLVIDGGSVPRSDSDRQVLEQIAKTADRFTSESDDGIYDAMNKGVELASGEYLLFLNAGDRLVADFPLHSLLMICRDEEPGMIWGYALREYSDGVYGVIKYRKSRWAWIGMPVCHQSALFNSRLFETMRYDTRLKIVADYELLLRNLRGGASIYYYPAPLSERTAGGISQTRRREAQEERDKVRSQYFRIPSLIGRVMSGIERFIDRLNSSSPSFYRAWRKFF